MTPNLAKEWLRRKQSDVDAYDSCCGDLADAVITEYGGDILYVDGDAVFAEGWTYHMIPLIDNLVHDAWCRLDYALTVREYLAAMFGADLWITVAVNGDDIYQGLCRDFTEDLLHVDRHRNIR